jgi:hypothetical protein
MGKTEEKPRRLYFKTYLQVIHNSVGSNMFRNFYVATTAKGEFDALNAGEDACAFYVSSILVIFRKISAVHGLVERVIEDMRQSGWSAVSEPEIGDVLVWEGRDDTAGKTHIGFYVGNNKAISNSSTQKTPIEHHMNFGKMNRKIIHVLRMENWEDDRPSVSGGPR